MDFCVQECITQITETQECTTNMCQYFIIIREVLILTLSIFIPLKRCISSYPRATGMILNEMISRDHNIQSHPCSQVCTDFFVNIYLRCYKILSEGADYKFIIIEALDKKSLLLSSILDDADLFTWRCRLRTNNNNDYSRLKFCNLPTPPSPLPLDIKELWNSSTFIINISNISALFFTRPS